MGLREQVAALPRDWEFYVTDDGDVVERDWPNFQAGLIPWDDLDDQELAKARLRNADGTFDNTGVRKLPRALMRDLIAESMRRFEEKNRTLLPVMHGIIRDVATGDIQGAFGPSPSDQLKAATYLLERTAGKTPDKVEVTATVKPWEGLVAGILTDDGVSSH